MKHVMNRFFCLFSAAVASFCLQAYAQPSPGVVPSDANQILRVETTKMPLVRVVLFFPFGSGDEKFGEEGQTYALMRWMQMGTQKQNLSAFNQSKQALGVTISLDVTPAYSTATIESPIETFEDSWKLLLEQLREPALNPKDFAGVRAQISSERKNRLSDAFVALKQLGGAAIYAGTKYAQFDIGTESGLANASEKRLKELYSKTVEAGPAAVLVSQTLPKKSEKIIQASISKWRSHYLPERPTPEKVAGRQLFIVDRPGSTQAYIIFMKDGPAPGTRDYAMLTIGTQLFGSNGGNSSILFDELRAKCGLTYHASFQTSPAVDRFFMMGVSFGANEKLGDLVSGYVNEWTKFYEKKTFSLEELKMAETAARAMRDRRIYETMGSVMTNAVRTFSVNGNVKPVWTIPDIEIDEFIDVKSRWLSPANLKIVVLGDVKSVRPILEKSLAPLNDVNILSENSDWDAIVAAIKKKKL